MSIHPTIPPKNLTEFTLTDLQGLMGTLGQPKYRAQQIYQWIFQKGARSIDEINQFACKIERAAMMRSDTRSVEFQSVGWLKVLMAR